MTMKNLANNLSTVRQKINRLEARYHRADSEVCLLAVSKTRSTDEIRTLANHGQIHFGENYVQEAVNKIAKMSDIEVTWHFIGPIQKNKTKLITEHFSWVHSIDRETIATRLSNQRSENLPPLNVCIQINIDEETSKSGISPSDLLELATTIRNLPKLNLRGLMAIPTSGQAFEQQCASFKKMSALQSLLHAHDFDTDTLSMGMSNDYEAAIACGSTMVRIGTAIFGPRNYL